jgi:hypothetical protein
LEKNALNLLKTENMKIEKTTLPNTTGRVVSNEILRIKSLEIDSLATS